MYSNFGEVVASRIKILGVLLVGVAACNSEVDDSGGGGDPPPLQNSAPTVSAGADQSVGEGRSVFLTATGSDPDGDTVTFTWRQVSGTSVELSSTSDRDALFIAPAIDDEISLEFQLSAADSAGATASDDVVIRITNDNPPTAIAGEDQVVREQSPVSLDGTASEDAEGLIKGFAWTQIGGVDIRIESPTTSRPTFIAPVVSENSDVIVRLTVTDEIGSTASDSLTISIEPADAGPIPSDSDQFLAFLNQSSALFQETEETAEAYYAAIDPRRSKTTLRAWKTANGFNRGNDARTVYRNAADLGFGRVMSIRTNNDSSVAAYVENYETLDIAVDAVESGSRDGLLATVAMEYSKHPEDPEGPMYTKFYTFNGNDDRVTKIDLDGSGEKFQPGLCLVCHGGEPGPLVTGRYPENGQTDSHFLPWDLDTFEYSSNPRYTRQVQQTAFREMNSKALSTYPKPLAVIDGHWSGDSSRELIEGWYGENGEELPETTFNGEFVPAGWRSSKNGGPRENPENAEELYLKVIGPNCRACHIQRGRVFAGGSQGELIDFRTYADIRNYREQIIDLVYDKGSMPNAKVTFDKFWSEQDGVIAAELLGVELGIDSTVRRPGRPIANPGPDRKAPVGNIDLNAAASLFAESFSWTFANSNGRPGNSNARIVGAQRQKPTLITDVPGQYRIQLVVGNRRSESDPVVLNITSLQGFEERSFSRDIVPILWNDCRSCHSIGESFSIPGVPALFDDTAALYSRATLYINFDDIAASPLVVKPAGRQHGAGDRPRDGFDLSGGTGKRDNYDKIIQWISEGAPNN